jgi:uncharacterized membrane protein YozB (DUF420 family)
MYFIFLILHMILPAISISIAGWQQLSAGISTVITTRHHPISFHHGTVT